MIRYLATFGSGLFWTTYSIQFLCVVAWKGAGQLLPERVAHPEALLRGTALPLRASAPAPNYQVGVELLFIYILLYIADSLSSTGLALYFGTAERKGGEREGLGTYTYGLSFGPAPCS
jgi:hypothetical protein